MSGGGFVLSGEDREQLVDWWDSDWPDEANGAIGSLITAVEAIVQRAVNAARVDAISDAADAWEANEGPGYPTALWLRWYALKVNAT